MIKGGKIVFLLALLLTLVVVLTSYAQGEPPPEPETQISCDPDEDAPSIGGLSFYGGGFSTPNVLYVSVCHFEAGEKIQVEAHDLFAGAGASVVTDAVVANADGDALAALTIPSQFDWNSKLQIDASGNMGSTASLITYDTCYYEEGAPGPQISVFSDSSPEDTDGTVTVYGCDFQAGEAVQVEVRNILENGEVVLGTVAVTADSGGDFRATLDVSRETLRSGYGVAATAIGNMGSTAAFNELAMGGCEGAREGAPDAPADGPFLRLMSTSDPSVEEFIDVLIALGCDFRPGENVHIEARIVFSNGQVVTGSKDVVADTSGAFVAISVLRINFDQLGSYEFEGTVTATGDMGSTATTRYDSGPPAGGTEPPGGETGGEVPGNTQDDQQGGDEQDNQQEGAKPTAPDNQQTGTGDAQDDKQGAGNVSDNQQTGAAPKAGSGTATVTKTYELTLYGNVPTGTAFSVEVENQTTGSAEGVWLCGSEGTSECEGGTAGSVYTVTRQYPAGTVLTFTWTRWIPGDPEGNPFATGSETLSRSMTNSAWFRFSGADNVQDDTEDKQQVQVDQQPAAKVSTEQQIPTQLPKTGGGGMAPCLSPRVGLE